MLAVGIGEDGQREILDSHPALQESSGAWKKFISQLKERGLSGVEHTSDAHEGLTDAIQEQLPGSILDTVPYRGTPRCTLPAGRPG